MKGTVAFVAVVVLLGAIGVFCFMQAASLNFAAPQTAPQQIATDGDCQVFRLRTRDQIIYYVRCNSGVVQVVK
jgi:hypothetical protein